MYYTTWLRGKLITNLVYNSGFTKLFYSEEIFHKTIRVVCEKYDCIYSKELQAECYGGTDRDICAKVVKRTHIPVTVAQFESHLNILLKKMLPSAPLKRGAERLLNHLHDKGIPLALVTNSNEQTVRLHALSRPKLFSVFDHMVCVSDADVMRGKPMPDIYLTATSRFTPKAKPLDCLVFEDSPTGVQASRAAGMQVVMVPGKSVDREHTRQASIVLRSLLDFKPELFGLPPFDDHRNRKGLPSTMQLTGLLGGSKWDLLRSRGNIHAKSIIFNV